MTPSPAKPLILWIAPYFYPKHYGGAVQIYDGLARRLQRHEAIFLTESQGVQPKDSASFDSAAPAERGYRVERLPRITLHFEPGHSRWRNLADAALFRWSLGRQFDSLVRRLRPAAVVCGGTYQGGWLMNRLPSGVARINYVLGEELTMGHLAQGPIGRWLRGNQVKAYRSADLNLVISRFTGDTLAQLAGVPPERIHFFPCFIDTTRFRPPADREGLRRRFGWEGRTVMLTIARLIQRKGVDQVLRALAQTPDLPPDWLYVIAGRGPEEENLKRLSAELGLGERVVFRGILSDEEVVDFYGAADLFIQTNRAVAGDTEGFGIVFLEANACGLPVIGGQAGGTADAIEEGVSGLRVDGDSVDAVGGAIRKLLSDAQIRSSMARLGLERVRSDFDATVMAEKFEALLAQRLAGQRR